LRRKKGISQEKLAQETGIARAYMSGLERGQHSPTIETIWKLLPGLGVNYPEFAAEFERAFARVARREANKNRA
jgi:transcriptional regulator with XRE-family HTH domain